MTRIALSLLSALSLAGACGKSDSKASSGAAAADPKAVEAAPKAAPIAVNEADWVVKNLHDVSPMINMSMKVPKDAKLEKNGNGGVDITVAPAYQLTVGMPAGSLEEMKKDDFSLTSSYENVKKLTDEPNGFIFTEQMKTEANGNKYQPEVHFYYYATTKDGGLFSVNDARPLSNFDAPGSTYSEALAKQVYGIVKASAKPN